MQSHFQLVVDIGNQMIGNKEVLSITPFLTAKVHDAKNNLIETYNQCTIQNDESNVV